MAVVQLKNRPALDATKYQSHALHAHDRAWPETNCYADVWFELLPALGYDPTPSLPFVFETDFEGDHFTFMKQSHEVLRSLHGLTVQELPVWRPLYQHIVEQHELGHPLLIEFDSFYLPDTVGLAYKVEHVKSTAGTFMIDVEGKRLGYFHSRGYYEVAGDDFDGVFRLSSGLKADPNILPPYVEMVKPSPKAALTGQALVDGSLAALKMHLARRPATNPVTRFRPRLESDVKWLISEGMAAYHVYVFNTVRMLGASFELGRSYFQWLTANKVAGLEESTAAAGAVSDGCKAMLMVLARAVTRKKMPDLSATIGGIEAAWDKTFQALPARLAG